MQGPWHLRQVTAGGMRQQEAGLGVGPHQHARHTAHSGGGAPAAPGAALGLEKLAAATAHPYGRTHPEASKRAPNRKGTGVANEVGCTLPLTAVPSWRQCVMWPLTPPWWQRQDPRAQRGVSPTAHTADRAEKQQAQKVRRESRGRGHGARITYG